MSTGKNDAVLGREIGSDRIIYYDCQHFRIEYRWLDPFDGYEIIITRIEIYNLTIIN